MTTFLTILIYIKSFVIGQIIGQIIVLSIFKDTRRFYKLLFNKKRKWERCCEIKSVEINTHFPSSGATYANSGSTFPSASTYIGWYGDYTKNRSYVKYDEKTIIYMDIKNKKYTMIMKEEYEKILSFGKLNNYFNFYNILIMLYFRLKLKNKSLNTYYPERYLKDIKMYNEKEYKKITRKEKLSRIG